ADVGVAGRKIDEIAVDGDAAHGTRTASAGRKFPSVLPNEISSRGIQCLKHAAWARNIHHTVIDDGCWLAQALTERPRPGQLKLIHILRVDLVQRTEPPAVERAPP